MKRIDISYESNIEKYLCEKNVLEVSYTVEKSTSAECHKNAHNRYTAE